VPLSSSASSVVFFCFVYLLRWRNKVVIPKCLVKVSSVPVMGAFVDKDSLVNVDVGCSHSNALIVTE